MQQPVETGVSPLLKEIANRIHKLPYRDLMNLTVAIRSGVGQSQNIIPEALLLAADILEA